MELKDQADLFVECCWKFENSNEKIPNKEIIFLWYDYYFDGPLSGFLQYQSQFYWFECYTSNYEENEDWYRKFIVLRLSEQEIEYEIDYQKLVVKFFGRETQYYQKNWQICLDLIPKNQVYNSDEMREYFYQFVSEEKDYRNNEIVGWFTL